MEFIAIIMKSCNKNMIWIKTLIKRVGCLGKPQRAGNWCKPGVSTDSRRSLWSFFSERLCPVGADGIPRYREHVSAVICPYYVTGG